MMSCDSSETSIVMRHDRSAHGRKLKVVDGSVLYENNKNIARELVESALHLDELATGSVS